MTPADGSPLRVGLIGSPIGHSRSPALQQAAFDALGIAARYELWETHGDAELAARVEALRAPGLIGANVTIPFKQRIIPLLDDLDESARITAGAVNTITREESAQGVRLIGHNTDAAALDRALDEMGAWEGARRMLILGAGGAAQAALGIAATRSVAPWVAARRADAARLALARLAERMPIPNAWQDQSLALDDRTALVQALAASQILVQATPVGAGDATATPLSLDLLAALPSGAAVLDLVYAPPETALVRATRELGLRAQGGLPMLLYQGALAFSLWTGQPAPLAEMRRALGLI